MSAAATWYCLADIAAVHYWTGTGFVPINRWLRSGIPILCYATRAGAEAEARRQREDYDGHLRVMAIRPGYAPVAVAPRKRPRQL
jgi:hypothetical protein